MVIGRRSRPYTLATVARWETGANPEAGRFSVVSSGFEFHLVVSSFHGTGSYTLEVRGKVTGTNGGSYAGVMNLAPVPEASNVALMLAGFGVFGIVAARRRGQAG